MGWFGGWSRRRAWRRAQELESSGRFPEARDAYLEAAGGSSDELTVASLIRAGMISTGLSDLVQARKLFDRARDAAPDNATAWLHVANAGFRLGDTQGADEAYHRALALAPDRPDILHYQAVYYGEKFAKAGLQAARRAGLALFDQLDAPGGEARVADLAFPRELPMIFIRNFALEKQLPDDGAAILREFADRPPGPATSWVRPAALNHLGLLLTNVGRYADALPLYGEALRLSPDFDAAHFNRAMTLLRLHQLDGARAAFSTYAKRDPTSPVTSFGLAFAAETAGDLREARRLYTFFLDRIARTPVAPPELALLDVPRTWLDHAREWLAAAARPSEGGSHEHDEPAPGAEGDVTDRPRGL